MNTTTTHVPDSNALLQCLQRYEQLAMDAQASHTPAVAAGQSMTARLRIASEELSVPLASIKALIRHPRIVGVPGTPEWMPGAVRVGQKMLAVIAGEWASGQAQVERHHDPALAVVLDLPERQVAVLVDAVFGLSQHDPHAPECTASGFDLNALSRRIEEQCRTGGPASRGAFPGPADRRTEAVGSNQT